MLQVIIDFATSLFNDIFGNSLFQVFQISFLFITGVGLLGMLRKAA